MISSEIRVGRGGVGVTLLAARCDLSVMTDDQPTAPPRPVTHSRVGRRFLFITCTCAPFVLIHHHGKGYCEWHSCSRVFRDGVR